MDKTKPTNILIQKTKIKKTVKSEKLKPLEKNIRLIDLNAIIDEEFCDTSNKQIE